MLTPLTLTLVLFTITQNKTCKIIFRVSAISGSRAFKSHAHTHVVRGPKKLRRPKIAEIAIFGLFEIL